MPADVPAERNVDLLAAELTEGSLARRLIDAVAGDEDGRSPETVFRARMDEIRHELENPNT